MIKRTYVIFLSICALSISMPVAVSATELATAPQRDGGAIELRIFYQKIQFFASKPPKMLGKLSLIKTEKAKGGYYGYYN